MMAERAVSIIIPCFKQAHYLPQAIECALGQTHQNIEVIVVDDGSPDDTSAVAARYGERVRCIRKDNHGLSAARNTGILTATGEYLIFLDADDLLPAEAVARHLAAAETAPADVTYADEYFYVDAEGRRYGAPFQAKLPEDAFHQYLLGNIFPPHAAMTRRSALANTGLFDVNLRSLEDWDMWLRLAASGARFAQTPHLAIPYRQYPTSMSKNFDRMRRCGFQVLEKARQHHPGCALCKKSIAHGRWGVRSAFWKHTKSGLQTGRWRPQALLRAASALAAALLHDPLLAGVGLRATIRNAKHRCLGS